MFFLSCLPGRNVEKPVPHIFPVQENIYLQLISMKRLFQWSIYEMCICICIFISRDVLMILSVIIMSSICFIALSSFFILIFSLQLT